MTLTLKLAPELEQRLVQEAKRHDVSVDTYTLRLLEKDLSVSAYQEKLAALLESWMDDDDDDQEQKETGDYLIRVLDEDRLSHRKLYPREMEGVTW